jgi:hypothetical protein
MKTDLSTRFTEAEAIRIAQEVDASDMFKNALSAANVEEKNNRVVWEISSVTIGKQLVMEVDDETGKIVDSKYIGIR